MLPLSPPTFLFGSRLTPQRERLIVIIERLLRVAQTLVERADVVPLRGVLREHTAFHPHARQEH